MSDFSPDDWDGDFGDEFDGVGSYNQPTAEILPANSLAYPDLAIGLHYSVTPATNRGVYIGVAYHHWNKPNISFFDNDPRTSDDFDRFESVRTIPMM